jgi:hypothetical protein
MPTRLHASAAGPGQGAGDGRGRFLTCRPRRRLHSCGHSAGFAPASHLTAPIEDRGRHLVVPGRYLERESPSTGVPNWTGRRYQSGMTGNTTRLVAIVTAIFGAAALRLIPHPPNFSPIDAMALFGGAYLGKRGLAFAAPFGALFLSDAILDFYPGMAFVYGSVAAIVLIGWLVASNKSLLRVAGGTVASSVLFFGVSNFGTWLDSGMYAHTLSGLAGCYTAAVPFFQNTLAGDLFYSALLFGGFALLQRFVPAVRGPALQPA